MGRLVHIVLLFVTDLILLLLALTVSWILVTGGGMYHPYGVRISAYSAQNPLTFLFLLVTIRFSIGKSIPFLNVKKFALTQVAGKAGQLCRDVYAGFNSLSENSANRLALVIIGVSVLVKVLNVWNYYGFFNGDDVEVHIMTLSKLFNVESTTWDLRSPFFPMVFIFPVQATIGALGITDPFYFVAAGRLVGVFFSALSCLLVYAVAAEEFKSIPSGLLALFLFAFSSLHIAYASSEEPRTVSSFFLLLSIWLLMRGDAKSSAVLLSGVSLAVSASMRFSEMIFIVPVILYLILAKRLRDALLVTMVFVVAAAVILGISDALFWGSPFYSLWHIVDYTLVQKLSSRGYEPFYQYLKVQEWSNYFLCAFFLLSFYLKNWKLILLAVVPILLLSTLPHKESRYLVPVIPFVTILAGAAIWRVLEFIQHPAERSNNSIAFVSPLLLVFMFCGSFLYEADGFRFRRSESAVDVSRYLRQQANVTRVAFQQAWKSGLTIYLPPTTIIEDFSPESFLTHMSRDGKPLLESVQYVAIESSSLDEHGYEPTIRQHGFTEVHFSDDSDEQGHYRLFTRAK